jgi:LCP family protein required for cell wall assembly
MHWSRLPVPGIFSEASTAEKVFPVLLLGTDARPGEEIARTDSIIVADIVSRAGILPAHNGKKQVALLSIPRDTRVNIPGHGMDKINAASFYDGPEKTAEVVSELIGIPVKYYVLTDWQGFEKIVDILGGVTINVEKRMRHYDSTDGPAYAINLYPGEQRLDGRKALQYVRYRSDALGDISRTQRQLNFLKALAHEIMQPSTVVKLPKLVPEINKSLKTNLSLLQMVKLAEVIMDFEQAEIVTQTLPGQFCNINGGSYWLIEPQKAHEVARALFEEGEIVNVVQGPTINDKVYPGNKQVVSIPLPQSRQASGLQTPADPKNELTKETYETLDKKAEKANGTNSTVDSVYPENNAENRSIKFIPVVPQ